MPKTETRGAESSVSQAVHALIPDTPTPLQDWAEGVDRSLSEPFIQLTQQIEEVKQAMDAIAATETAKLERRSTLFLLGLLFTGVAWIQVGHPLISQLRQSAADFAATAKSSGQQLDLATAPNGKVAAIAQSLVGSDFAPGQREQCAVFVRFVLAKAGLRVGVTQQPVDKQPSGEALANGFFGPDIGEMIQDPKALRPGDLVAFGGTYNGYPASTITHVAIYMGEGQIVDRPTANEPVKKRAMSTFKHFVAGVRPRGL